MLYLAVQGVLVQTIFFPSPLHSVVGSWVILLK